MEVGVENEDVRKLAELMRQDPGLKVNTGDGDDGWTLLHHACFRNDGSPLIPLLLAHPDIDVNVKNTKGETPFHIACRHGSASCVREMLRDSRVKVNELNNDGYTPLFWAAYHGHIEVIKWLIASGRRMDLGKPEEGERGAIWVAMKRGRTGVVTLLERYKSDATQTRHAMRLELDLLDELAAEMFALVVFVSDGILQINDTTTTTPAARFFSIAAQLPLELQMVLCFRSVGSDQEIIPGKESEVAFKELARKLL